ncbi:MAG: dipeptidase PepV [Clostridia bacterium]|nr:dipeptidase PepV [Clostridia bacterium]
MDFYDIIEKNKDEMFQKLAMLVRIRSVQEDSKGNMPFGEGIHDALEFTLREAQFEGFSVMNFDNYGAHIEWGSGQEILGIPCHLDVVAEGDQWEHDPYGADVCEGKMYGRGTADNKGPLIAVLYAMKALKEAGFEPSKRIRLILGLDEETDWVGMHYYLERAEEPDIAFTPDGDFPLIRGEKGALVFDIAKKFPKVPTGAKGITFRAFEGGRAANMVPDSAKLLVMADDYEALKEKVSVYKKETGYVLTYRTRGKSFEVSAEGRSAHGASPDLGLNAISILMDFAGRISFTSEEVMDFIEFYNKHIGFCTDGSRLGCGFSDEESGKLVFNVGMIESSPQAARLTINVRYPLSFSDEQVYSALMPAINQYDMGLIKRSFKKPVSYSMDSPLVKTFISCYQKHTGDNTSEPVIMNGASYARALKNCMCFGMLFPGEEDTMHQKDEYVSLESLLKGAKIYADIIAQLSS